MCRRRSDDQGRAYVPSGAGQVRSSLDALYGVYKSWCERNGHRWLNNTDFAGDLQKRGFEQVRRTGGTRAWIGLALLRTPSASIVVG